MNRAPKLGSLLFPCGSHCDCNSESGHMYWHMLYHARLTICTTGDGEGRTGVNVKNPEAACRTDGRSPTVASTAFCKPLPADCCLCIRRPCLAQRLDGWVDRETERDRCIAESTNSQVARYVHRCRGNNRQVGKLFGFGHASVSGLEDWRFAAPFRTLGLVYVLPALPVLSTKNKLGLRRERVTWWFDAGRIAKSTLQQKAKALKWSKGLLSVKVTSLHALHVRSICLRLEGKWDQVSEGEDCWPKCCQHTHTHTQMTASTIVPSLSKRMLLCPTHTNAGM